MRTRTDRFIQVAICIFQVAICNFLQPDAAFAQTAPAEPFPYRQKPVDYFAADLADPVAKLSEKFASGDTRLEFEKGSGWLHSLLKALDVPVESQMLVFAKNSVNARIISPDNPRALYFNDSIYIGFVPGAPFLEISGVDPRKGAIFYSLAQKSDEPPKLVREESCLLCHASANSLTVPGHLVRSFVTDINGNPVRGHSKINHETPLARRWGGFYVTGDFGAQQHLGNLSTAADLLEYDRHRDGPGRPVNLAKRIDVSKYPAAHSDVVAMLVHDHQTHLHNLITRVNYEHQFQREMNSEEELIRYVLFIDEAPLENPILGSSAYEAWFEKQGPCDQKGRSLRQFDLETRLFKYRCSYLIYSEAFDGLPKAVKERLYRRLWDVLIPAGPPAPFDRIPRPERMAIVEILRETKKDLPEFWKQHAVEADSRGRK